MNTDTYHGEVLEACLTLIGLVSLEAAGANRENKTIFNIPVGGDKPAHQEENHRLIQEIHKTHRLPNYLFFCPREETSESRTKPGSN